MQARFSGTCNACQSRHIHAGDEIVRHRSGWAKEKCVEEAEALRTFIKEMAAKGLWLGCWDAPEGSEATFSRREFLGKAKKLGATDEIVSIAHRHWIGILDRDLAD